MVACSTVPAAGASSVRHASQRRFHVTRFCVVKPRRWMRLLLARAQAITNHTTEKVSEMFPRHVNPMQWQLAMDYARQACARIFRDGGSASDALSAFNLAPSTTALDWNTSVNRIAEALCVSQQRKAA